MSEMIQDPLDPSKFIVGSAAIGDFGMQTGAVTIGNVHDPRLCAGRPCVMHAPSEHHMRTWPLNWRDDKGQMERFCPHNIGHPDPDDMDYHRSVGRAYLGVHSCDGCCAA